MIDRNEIRSMPMAILRPRFWLALLIGATIAGLLCSGTVRSDDNPTANDEHASHAPANRAEALAFIQEVNDRKQAESLAALEEQLTPVEAEWGIKFLGLRMIAAGYAINFQYKVLDPEKAAPLLNRSFNLKPFLHVEKSGAKLGVPFTQKAGSLRSSVTTSSQVKRGRNYSVMFANPGHHVVIGDEVTIVIGDFMAEHIEVM